MKSKAQRFSRITISMVLFLLAGLTSASAQGMTNTNSLPVYPGGNSALKKFIDANLHYPEKALKEGISGTVLVSFLIDKQGNTRDIKVLQGLNQECDAEAVRVAGLIKGWAPAVRSRKPVDIIARMPVEFRSDINVKKIPVTGKVTDRSKNIPIEGAIVLIKGTNVGTLTDKEGNYSLEVLEDNQYLEIFATGYSLITQPIQKHRTINIELDPEYWVIEFQAPEVE